MPELEAFISAESERTANVDQLVTKVKSMTRPNELTPELVHEFIEKIVVSEARYVDGKRVQVLDIYYSGVSVIKGFSPEEQEKVFELGMERRRNEKTA